MNIELFSLGLLVIATLLSVVNIYLFFSKRSVSKKLLSMDRTIITDDIIDEKFTLLKKELKLLEARQRLIQEQAAYDASRIESIEKLISALLASSGGSGFGGGGYGGFGDGNGTLN